MKQAILDTDTISFFFRGNKNVVRKIDEYLREYGFINISIISYYEILNGLLYKDAKNQKQKFMEFIKQNQVLPLNLITVNRSAEIYANLRKTGQIISHTDVLIAGTAIVNNLILITNNVNHFKRINKLQIDNWVFK